MYQQRPSNNDPTVKYTDTNVQDRQTIISKHSRKLSTTSSKAQTRQGRCMHQILKFQVLLRIIYCPGTLFLCFGHGVISYSLRPKIAREIAVIAAL